jgi:cyclophilin family peptidyl-prolyl cis-trans isomerase
MYTFAYQKIRKMKKILFFTLTIIIPLSGNLNAQNKPSENLTTFLIQTDSGNIKLVLYDETKLHKENFIKLAKAGYFDDQLFHRLIKDFMIQGGDPNSKNAVKGELLGQGGPGYTIPAEINPKYFHKKGALAAARKGDDLNPAKESSGSQFYIITGSVFTKDQLDLMVSRNMHSRFSEKETEAYTTIGGSPHLDGGYTVFGEVIEGFDVLEKLMKIPVDAYDRPLTDIKFRIKILE